MADQAMNVEPGPSTGAERMERWVLQHGTSSVSASGSGFSREQSDEVSVHSGASRGSSRSGKSSVSRAKRARKLAENELRDLEEIHQLEKEKMEKEIAFLKQRVALKAKAEESRLLELADSQSQTDCEFNEYDSDDQCVQNMHVIDADFVECGNGGDEGNVSPDPEVTFPKLSKSSC